VQDWIRKVIAVATVDENMKIRNPYRLMRTLVTETSFVSVYLSLLMAIQKVIENAAVQVNLRRNVAATSRRDDDLYYHISLIVCIHRSEDHCSLRSMDSGNEVSRTACHGCVGGTAFYHLTDVL
jgi:hypothetical protein